MNVYCFLRLLVGVILIEGCSSTKIMQGPEAPQTLRKAAPKAPAPGESPYLGMQMQNGVTIFDPPLKGTIREAIRVENVFPGSPADKAGLKVGDFILGKGSSHEINEETLKAPVGTVTSLLVMSGVSLKVVRIKSEKRPLHFGDLNRPSPKNFWNLNDKSLSSLGSLLKERNFEPDTTLRESFLNMSEQSDPLRPPAVHFLQAQPLLIQDFRSALLTRLQSCKSETSCLSKLELLGRPWTKPKRIKLKSKKLQDHLSFIAAVLDEAERIHDLAYRQFKISEIQMLRANVPELSDRFQGSLYLHMDSFQGRKERLYETLRLLGKLEIKYFFESLLYLEEHFNRPYLEQLKTDLKELSSRERIGSLKTRKGPIVIFGTGDTYHARNLEPIRLRVDLGGDDFYQESSGLIIDLSGNDRYESALSGSLGGSLMKLGLLMDFEGNDSYKCLDFCLGSSALGAALMIDGEGKDAYETRSYSIGTAFAGLGVFLDGSGEDSYRSHQLSQGLGVAGGYGLLLDFAGDDTYISQSPRPSAYGDKNQYETWSQGVGLGLRYFASGGIGILYDKSGKDQFEAGTFSQGGGYFFGLGALINDGEAPDSYKGMRYTQGFSAHSAIGIFCEIGGNDRYASLSVVGQGIAWDLGISLFEDFQGDDEHKTGEHCLGAASHNSFAYFIDYEGRDTYHGDQLPPSIPIPNDYHGGESLGFFLDRGNSHDSYIRMKNGSCAERSGRQVLCDE